ncbi:hypothetical protein C8F04DRAFT_960328 [Mycena alexandri]|uniref:DUF6589 domain-containing protein n=1 Tax=Mycena alexandri TaxID=1745969 RepID=A0AAD6S7Q5_9AGAR|nr:hypothetical protein C8F04DRAFT_971522 [Mycena alexandri]KAJ7022594.1 hypothetical protein C8F04DRAFT_971329 [Mycena alexandri]KAJ7022597.1 hypothetical protein C8F04DRAFT_971299 [Mycena alexandri]KAJ7031503.1 hypothetical protein C8F04DRAFT_960328 [Mycena alexandri]
MGPPTVDVDVRPSDDVLFTPRTEKALKSKAAQLKRRSTLELQRAAAQARVAQIALEKRALLRAHLFDKVLDDISAGGFSFAEFAEYVFDPDTKLKTDWRWRGFFQQKATVERIFGYWSSSRYNTSTRATVLDWAISLVAANASAEAQGITSSGILSKSKKVINEEYFLGYNLAGLTATLRGMAPIAFRILDAFSTTPRQLRENSAAGLRRKELLRGSAALSLLKGFSQYNNYAQSIHSAYLAATGAPRQHFSVLGALGVSLGYTTVISKGVKKHKTATKQKPRKKKARAPGLLTMLSDACNATSRAIAASGMFVTVYDNINMMVRVAEQILGRKNAQENGTCATIVPLHDAKPEDLLTTTLDASVLNAPPLRIEHLLLNPDELDFHTKNMVHTILRIIVRHGGDGFKKWQKDLDAMQPASPETIAVHKTPIHPLPSMEIDENSITGNIEVMDAINKSLGLNADEPEYLKYVKIIAGDQLTIARQRSILTVRLGHESGSHAWRNIVLMPGLFHAKIADTHGMLETHFGKPNAGTRSPGSLGFHNTVLDRLPITLTSLPAFRTCRDLIMVSLYARVLHCLLLVSGKDSLDDYASSVNSWDVIVGHAAVIYSRFADPDLVQELREQRIPDERKRDAEAKAASKGANKGAKPDGPLPHVKKGDMVFENAILFLRDALLTREFTDAVKAGDSGRVVNILRLWVFSYRGSGRSKYAHEMLHLLHNLICVWTRELRHIILQNWLLNPTGKPNSFVEIDLVQEHLNFWIKKIYKADGDGHSWDWLALVSPCVDILRTLATRINTDLGARQGAKHTIPNLTEDIAALMDSLNEHDVYTLQPGRVLDDDEKPVPDILAVGMAALTHGASTTPLADFNRQFESLRERRRLTPIADLLHLLDVDGDAVLPPVELPVGAAPAEDDQVALPRLEEIPDSDEEEGDVDAGEEELLLASPTLTRLNAEDVALDMDVHEWYLDGEEDDSDYEGSGGESDDDE